MRTLSLLTAEKFARVAPVLGSCELIDGEIVPMSPGGMRHSAITATAASLLDQHVRPLRLGRVLTGEAGLIVARGPDSVRGADVAFISYDRYPAALPLAEGFLTVPPELVIEVLGNDVSWTEMEKKIAHYQAFGVDAVWILDSRMMALRVYPRNGVPFTLQRDDEVRATHPAGFTCRVADFLA